MIVDEWLGRRQIVHNWIGEIIFFDVHENQDETYSREIHNRLDNFKKNKRSKKLLRQVG